MKLRRAEKRKRAGDGWSSALESRLPNIERPGKRESHVGAKQNHHATSVKLTVYCTIFENTGENEIVKLNEFGGRQ